MDQKTVTVRLDRRRLGIALAGTAVAAALPVALPSGPAGAATAADSEGGGTVRVTTIPAATTGGLLDQLVAAFEAQSPYQVEVTVAIGPALFNRGRTGEADLVLTHLGFVDLQQFVSDGFGRWPQLLYSSLVVFLAPPDDPARIRWARDPVRAFRRIARTRSPFVVNNGAETLFVTDTLWNAAGRPDRAGWFLDPGQSGPGAVREASDRGAYTLWGLHPFLTSGQQPPLELAAVTFDDSLLQRSIASVAVDPARVPGVNLTGALALEQFLTAAATQARIRRFRHPGLPHRVVFWPTANNNENRVSQAGGGP